MQSNSNSKPIPIPEPQKLSSNTNTLNDKTIPATASTAPITAGKAKNQRDSRNRRNGGGGANNKSLKTIPDQSQQTHVTSNTDKQTVNGTA